MPEAAGGAAGLPCARRDADGRSRRRRAGSHRTTGSLTAGVCSAELHTDIHSSFTHNCSKPEATKVSFCR